MPRLTRRHIPLGIRCQVAARQLGWKNAMEECAPATARQVLDLLLTGISQNLGCDVSDLHLDHEPALVNRKQIRDRDGVLLRYEPDEHDPDCLIYREKGDHLIKTHVRGDHGQFSDTALAKRARRRAKKASGRVKRKTKWPSGRKLQSRGFQK